jgi:hemin uptake protein HemP
MAESRIDPVSQSSIAAISTVAARKPRSESQRLFQGNSEIVIVHHDEEYSLRITKNGKLILTK